jgi:prepilin-type N-terminal cleavage/methylation domain-containing protein
MTLVEILVVVAIIGVMAGLASVGLQAMARIGAVNGGADALVRLMATVRARAITERCRYILQINGPEYAQAAAGAPADVLKVDSTALVYRKGVCNSPVVAFEPGLPAAQADKLVDQFPLGDMRIVLVVPPALLAAERVTRESVTFSWNELGQRSVAVDDDSDGVSTPVPTGGDITVTVRAAPGTDSSLPSRDVIVPQAGRATSP